MFKRSAILALTTFALFGCGKEANFVNDEAKLFSPEQAENVATFHRYLLADHDIDYRVITSTVNGDLNQYATEQFEAQQVGSTSKGGRGLLLVLNTTQNKVRLEVSRALEAAYPDAFIGYIEQRQMTPFFAAGRVADGVLATTEMIVTRAQHAQANQGWDDETWSKASTSGGGATANARLEGKPLQHKQSTANANVNQTNPAKINAASSTPENTLQAYMQAMSERNANPNLNIYTAETRAMLNQWVVTPAQMDNITQAYRGCHAEATRYDAKQTLAVIRYPVSDRACSPWFFIHSNDGWQLDLTAMQKYIRFGRDNSWHFDWRILDTYPYRFAFTDWGFDNRGYPQKMRWNMTVSSDLERKVWVDRLGDNSPALAFGFQVGDQLLSWNGMALFHHQQVMQAMKEAVANELVSVEIIRDGKSMKLEGLAPP